MRPSLFESHSRSPSWLAVPGLCHWDGETLGGNIAGPLREAGAVPGRRRLFLWSCFQVPGEELAGALRNLAPPPCIKPGIQEGIRPQMGLQLKARPSLVSGKQAGVGWGGARGGINGA